MSVEGQSSGDRFQWVKSEAESVNSRLSLAVKRSGKIAWELSG